MIPKWLYKNKDPLENDLELCISSSKNPILGHLFREFALNTAAFATVGDGKQASTRKQAAMFTTVGTAYAEQLNALLDTLGNTSPHFVRCIIPNHKKVPGEIDDNIVLDQLACNGVLDVSRSPVWASRIVLSTRNSTNVISFLLRMSLLLPQTAKPPPLRLWPN